MGPVANADKHKLFCCSRSTLRAECVRSLWCRNEILNFNELFNEQQFFIFFLNPSSSE